MKNVDKAYIAGIVDGEGTVTLTRLHKNETPSPVVSIANNNLALLQWIKTLIGGIIVNKKKYKAHHMNSYVWSVRQNRALKFLKDIKQYLRIKNKHADMLVNDYKSVAHRAGKYSPEMLKQNNELVQKIRKLNKPSMKKLNRKRAVS